jgi:hypothetical protein
MSCNDDLEEFIKIVKIDSFEIAILNLLHQTLKLCEQGPTSEQRHHESNEEGGTCSKPKNLQTATDEQRYTDQGS